MYPFLTIVIRKYKEPNGIRGFQGLIYMKDLHKNVLCKWCEGN